MTYSDPTIRGYRAADMEALSAIWFDASRIAHPFIGETRLREQRILIETVYLPQAETLVAIHRDVQAGFISLMDDFIGGLFVSPHHQGSGIGRALIDRAIESRARLHLEVYTANARACAFYRSLGFVETGRRPIDDQGLPFENARMTLTR